MAALPSDPNIPPPGHIPTGAVQGGYNDSNDPLYIGRARHEDSFAVGKVRSSEQEAKIIINYNNYDLLNTSYLTNYAGDLIAKMYRSCLGKKHYNNG